MLKNYPSSFIKYNWPGLSWALFIFIVSTITPPSIYVPDLFDLFAPDKVVHFFVYAVQCFLLINGFNKSGSVTPKNNKISIAFFLAASYGGLIELYQGFFLKDRTGDWVDFLANCIGAVIGVIVFKIYSSVKLKLK